jgi:molybdate transport system regulatory protein
MQENNNDPLPPSSTQPTLRLHVWLELENGHFFGLGRAQLLQRIQRHGSLSKAAEEMRMSYRAAWGKIKSTEEIMGVRLVEKVGGNKSGFRLTEHGEKIMKDFLAWYADLEKKALKSAEKKLPWELRRFKANH